MDDDTDYDDEVEQEWVGGPQDEEEDEVRNSICPNM